MTTATEYRTQATTLSLQVRNARCCDALDPCHACRTSTEAARALMHWARVADAQAARHQ